MAVNWQQSSAVVVGSGAVGSGTVDMICEGKVYPLS